jgi:hypothetical protein
LIVELHIMAKKIYLPPKSAKWSNTQDLGDPKDLTHYGKPHGDMNVLNEKEIKDAINPPVDEDGEYKHKDGEEDRHPQTLYLTPKAPRHRSDSLDRS